MHQQALELSIDGMNIRWIARHLGVNHETGTKISLLF